MSGDINNDWIADDSSSDSSSEEEGLRFKFDKSACESTRECIVATPAEFVSKFGGNFVIEKVLVANNGIAAVKCIRSMRQWAYELFGNEKVIKFVAMVTPEDLKANAEYIKLADHFIHLPGGPNNNNYANVELIVDIAKSIPVQAVWAGWGHASENPKLPELLDKNGIAFIGPSSLSMWALGDKVASSILAQMVDIPTLPWSGSDIRLKDSDIMDEDKKLKGVPDYDYQRACVTDVITGLNHAREIGYPVMIKASEGGGGKGIRKANNDDEFSIGFRQVEMEVPGSPIFIMKCLNKARHLEVQILADQYGNAISLFGRDCSVQRRHQKIIEEGPATICDDEIFVQMEKNAVKLAKLVGYKSAGTVEYLFDDRTKEVYFLELNPRLQVEHPCTEMITDVNLAAAQLQIAMGIPLHRIKDIRLLYGEDPWGSSMISYESFYGILKPKGHVVACRVTAENPDEGFKPNSGSLKELSYKSSNHNWGYFSVGADGSLHEYADSQFGHLFAWGEDREAARKGMVITLKEISIRGDFRTTVEFLIRLLETDVFKKNRIDTTWLDTLIAENVKAESPDIIAAVICGGLHIADNIINSNFASYQAALERGQVPKPESLCNTEVIDLIHEKTKYMLTVTKSGPTTYFINMNDSNIDVDLHRMTDGGLMVSFNETTYTSFMKEEVDSYRVVINGKTCTFKKENDPTILRSPSPGKLINFTIEDGGHVFAGEAYAEIEVMKMVMPLISNVSGCLHYVKCAGTVLEPGMILARLSLDDPSKVFEAELYTKPFPSFTQKRSRGTKMNQIFQVTVDNLTSIMDGFCTPEPHFSQNMEEQVAQLVQVLRDPSLPLLEMQELLASGSGRIPAKVVDSIKYLLAKYQSNITSILNQFPSQQISNTLDSHSATLTKRADRDLFFANTHGISQLVQRYRNGIKGHAKSVILGLLRQYLHVEKLFNEAQNLKSTLNNTTDKLFTGMQLKSGNFEKCVTAMVDANRDKTMEPVIRNIFSHVNVTQKNLLIIKLIDYLCGRDCCSLSDDVRGILQEMTHLNRQEHSKVTLKARKVLISSQKPSYELRHNQFESIFLSAIDLYGHQFSPDNLQKIILSETAVFDVLPSFFYHRNDLVRMAALEVYIRRSYQAYDLTQVQHDIMGNINLIEFMFKLPNNHPNKAITPEKKISLSDQPRYKILRVHSVSDSLDETGLQVEDKGNCERMGAMIAVNDVPELLTVFDKLLERFKTNQTDAVATESFQNINKIETNEYADDASVHADDPIHIINVCIKDPETTIENQEEEKNKLQAVILEKKEQLIKYGIRRISILVTDTKGGLPHIYTFRARDQFYEDVIYRHLEAALAFQLELNRMRSFNLRPVPSTNNNLHLYFGSAKKERNNQEVTDYRFFIRSIVRHDDFVTKEASFDYLEKTCVVQLLEALDELELARSKANHRTDCNHIFLNFVPTVIIEPHKIVDSIRMIVLRHGQRLWKLRCLQAEVKMVVKTAPDSEIIPLRLFLSNQSGYSLDIHTYKEMIDSRTGELVFQSFGERQGPYHGLPVSTPYVTKDHLQYKRYTAQSHGTTYVYDYPELFKQVLVKTWKQWTQLTGIKFDQSREYVNFIELALDEHNNAMRINRLPGANDCGIVAWEATLNTPEYPEGRKVYVCSNDITHMIGSFSCAEDYLYDEVLKLAMKEKVPFLFISSNSGAKIGLAEDVKQLFKVAWNEKGAPEKGFKYLYLTPAEFKSLTINNSVRAEPVEEDGECRYKITDVIGKEDGIGVENLKGSGLIAGRTSEAYDKIITFNLVSCRTVGIGAYLNRLGQRVVQVDNSSIILTGHQALNKLLGRHVYTSNMQLGGTQIMYKNGISHLVAPDDIAGVNDIVKWLGYLPKAKGEPLPILPVSDPIEREITFVPPKHSYNARQLLVGRDDPENPEIWESGLFDKESFTEVLGGWAQTVICGRARLGGIPVAVILPEAQPVEKLVPPDPADPVSESKATLEAGQVWYPDSSYKTAQSINDFNREELPLIIIANWRGFSGGMKDMYDQVLKFGAHIVDALRQYTQPVIIYIPKHGELRGGAWVVVDPSINPEYMELYADEESRGGILEPSGTAEIKFKQKDLSKTMKRLDDTYKDIILKMGSQDLSRSDKIKLDRKLHEREKELLPIYQQIAVTFCDLHDTAGRMREKGVCSGILKWNELRKFLYWRLKRLLLQESLRKMMCVRQGDCKKAHMQTVIERLFLEDNGSVQSYLWEDNEFVAKWIESDIAKEEGSVLKEYIKWYKRDVVLREIKSIVDVNPDVAMDAIVHITQQITSTNRHELSRVLCALNDQCDDGDTKSLNEENGSNSNKPLRTLSLPCTLSGMGIEHNTQ